MRCVDCEYYNILYGHGWCDIYKRSCRVSQVDALRDAPCWKYDRRKKKEKQNE